MRSLVARWRTEGVAPASGPERITGVPMLRVTMELPLPVALPLLACAGAGSTLLRAGSRRAGATLPRARLFLRAGPAVPVAGGRGGQAGLPALGDAGRQAGFAAAMREGRFLFAPLSGSLALAREWRIHRLALRCRALLVPSR